MSVASKDKVADLRRTIAELQRQLDERSVGLNEALEQQSATAEVLEVINQSPGDLVPVFEAMLDKALGLCGAAFGILWTYDGEQVRAAALRGVPPAVAEFLTRAPHPVGSDNAHSRLLRGEPLVHIADAAEDKAYRSADPVRRALVDQGGARALLGVPLRKDDALLGAFVIYRQEVRPFSDKQITLLQNFSAQAVIAMENARLFGELRERTDDLQEALEYQTATSDVLKVISRSAFALQPVLDTVVDTAARLCSADDAGITLRDGEVYRYVATTSSTSSDYATVLRGRAFEPGRGTMAGRVALEGNVVHIADITADPDYAFPEGMRVSRTLLGVPLLRDGVVVGTLTLSRQRVEPFTQRQVELVQTFADQAVIAVENARLIAETREALDQQTATAEVLQVINSSPGNLAPVFDAMLEKALRSCEASFGSMHRYDREYFHTLASRGLPALLLEFLAQPLPPFPGDALDFLVRGEAVVHIADVQDTDVYRKGSPGRRALVEVAQAGTALWIALRKDGALLGCFVIYRQEVRPFTEKQIALAQSFAAQAVIAMDNARLLDEIRQRQAELRITFDNMGDGVVMFDAELRLAAWNRNFQELLDLPDSFLAERPSYADYIHRLAARGEFAGSDIEAEIDRRLADTDQEVHFERTRPDGQVIEVRRMPVPGGGFVLIYGDVTERRRAEAEVRAARDAAENALGELKAAQANLIQAEKMASLGQLTAGIAHEIKNPLNFVNNFAGLSVELLDELKETAAPAIATLASDKRAELDEAIAMLTGNLEKITEHGRRADGIVKSMLAHSRGGTGERRSADINALVEESLNLAYHGARAQDQNFNITLERDYDKTTAPIELVPQDITRVFLNLCGNGFYAANKRRHEAGEPDFRPVLKVSTRELGNAVEVRIRDNGIGIPAEIKEKLFQPFFTTKPTGEGTGLGLSISYDIVTQQHGGTIEVDSRVGDFAEFTIRLPRNRQTANRGAS
jgi:two-component system, NtrC family, sensor kinase